LRRISIVSGKDKSLNVQIVLIIITKSLQRKRLRGRKASPFRAGMDSPLIESSNFSFFKISSVTLTTLLLSSTEGLMGPREERPLSPLPSRGQSLAMKVPLSNGSGPLTLSTAPQMRDVIPNR